MHRYVNTEASLGDIVLQHPDSRGDMGRGSGSPEPLYACSVGTTDWSALPDFPDTQQL